MQANKYEIVTFHVRTVFEIIRRASAVGTLADRLGVVGEIDGHAVVKHAQAAFPEAVVAIRFAVFHDAAVDLIHICEAALFHHGTDGFAADAARAIRDDFLVFDIVVFVAFEFSDKVAAGVRVWHNRVLELADFSFVGVATVKEHNVVAVLLDHLVHLLRFEVLTAANHAVFIDVKLVVAVLEANEFAAILHTHTRKIFTPTIAPLEHRVFETRKLLCFFDIFFQIFHLAANCTVETLRTHEDTPFEIKTVGQRFLPQFDRLWVGNWREFVVEKNLLHQGLLYHICQPVPLPVRVKASYTGDMPDTAAGVDTLQMTLFIGFMIFIVIFFISYLAWHYLRPPKVRVSRHSSLLSALDTTDKINSIEFITPDGLKARTHLSLGAVHDYSLTIVHLPWWTATHILGVPTSQVDTLESVDKSLEKIRLEGNYDAHFRLFAEPGNQVDVRYILDPAAMAVTIDFLEHYYWEIYRGALYVSSHSDTPDPESLDKFIATIRPALETPNPHFDTSN